MTFLCVLRRAWVQPPDRTCAGMWWRPGVWLLRAGTRSCCWSSSAASRAPGAGPPGGGPDGLCQAELRACAGAVSPLARSPLLSWPLSVSLLAAWASPLSSFLSDSASPVHTPWDTADVLLSSRRDSKARARTGDKKVYRGTENGPRRGMCHGSHTLLVWSGDDGVAPEEDGVVPAFSLPGGYLPRCAWAPAVV